MIPFLEKLAKELLEKYQSNFSNICVVFPSRRAGVFFKKYLSQNIKAPVWAPEIFAIQDFIAKFSPYHILDRLSLIFELYEVYKQHTPGESFDKFYPWGDMLINDFEEIDKNLVKADYLFRILLEHKQIEMDFDVKISDMEHFYKFWSSFSNRELSETQNEFIKTWEVMGKVYKDFRKTLINNNTAYEGMAYRRIYEMLRTNELETGYDNVIFAGFNSITKSEEGIISEMIKHGKAETYWDADAYYANDKQQEAGYYLRKSLRNLKIEKPAWVENSLLNTQKNIKAIGAPLQVSQAKVLGDELKKLNASELDKTAIVLPDEGLLASVLHSIPPNIDSLNITMGFPLKNSSLYSLIQLLRDLQNNKKGNQGSAAFYYKDVLQILQHNYIKYLSTNEIYGLVNEIKKRNKIYISRKHILNAFKQVPEIISAIFNDIYTSNDSLDYLYKIISLISDYRQSNSAGSVFDGEYLFKVYTEINRLYDILNKYSSKIDFKTFWRILIEILNMVKVPFTGEPLKGMQIMGLLETRSLDFDNVYILSMNEGILPKGNIHSSFIPYSLRKAFNLPTYDDADSNSAYYFYGLLQRAKNVCLIYNTEPGKITSAEKSRFIMQVENELAVENKDIKFESLLFQTDVGIPKRKEIAIQKSQEIIDSLKAESHFSVSTLSNYVSCPLKFYFKTVAKLKEEESVDEFFTGAGFGSILHEIMNLLYTEYKGEIVSEKTIKELRNKLNTQYDKLWEAACTRIREFEEFKADLSGKNLLQKSIIKKLIEKILDNDSKEAPFKILDIEQEITREISVQINGSDKKIKLLGRLDRIEEKDGILRIIDYKTGRIDKQKLKSGLGFENFGVIFEDPNFKERFQQYLYSYIYTSGNTDLKIKIGVYPLRYISEGIVFFEENSIEPGRMEIFEYKLSEMLNKIFDSTTPFTQTADIERCRYCEYKSICYRD